MEYSPAGLIAAGIGSSTGMAVASTRLEFQQLSRKRLAEAKSLLDAGQYEGAYYLIGYAIEFALKACVCRRRMRSGIFPEKNFSNDLYTHDLEKLVRLAKLETIRNAWMQKHRTFATRWVVVARWKEDIRYEVKVSAVDAHHLYLAVTAPKLGALTWLKKYW